MIDPFLKDINNKAITNKLRLNNQDYQVVLTLYNFQGSVFPLNTASLVSLVIEESSLQWYKKGTLILKNSENVLERRPNELFSRDFNYYCSRYGVDSSKISC